MTPVYPHSCTVWEHQFVPYSEVSLSQEFWVYIFPVGMVLHNWDVEDNVATFSELSLAVCSWERLNRGQYYMNNSANLMTS